MPLLPGLRWCSRPLACIHDQGICYIYNTGVCLIFTNVGKRCLDIYLLHDLHRSAIVYITRVVSFLFIYFYLVRCIHMIIEDTVFFPLFI